MDSAPSVSTESKRGSCGTKCNRTLIIRSWAAHNPSRWCIVEFLTRWKCNLPLLLQPHNSHTKNQTRRHLAWTIGSWKWSQDFCCWAANDYIRAQRYCDCECSRILRYNKLSYIIYLLNKLQYIPVYIYRIYTVYIYRVYIPSFIFYWNNMSTIYSYALFHFFRLVRNYYMCYGNATSGVRLKARVLVLTDNFL